jgi:hemoglobin
MFDRVGGEAFFVRLVADFYRGVAQDPLLRPLYPDDLSTPEDHLRAFLIQYWGGPDDYSRSRGHPRLRLRHAPFVIGPAERDAWLAHMTAAVRAAPLTAEDEAELVAYFEMAASSLVNAPDERPRRPSAGRHLPQVPAPGD